MQNTTLNTLEAKYWELMKPKSGTLYIKGRPGEAKTAIPLSIANKLGFQYFDLRLSQMDETDIGLFPVVSNGYVSHVPPEWAFLANRRPTIIVFEELNRSRPEIRNAALQILNERRIGYNFTFNENVYMCSTGNLGEEDGCDVEEFDSALVNRLIPVKHVLTLKDWKEGFATENVIPHILNFIEAHPEHYYRKPTEDGEQFATARSWTMLSNYIVTSCGAKSPADVTLEQTIQYCKKSAYNFVGISNVSLVKFLEDMSNLTVDDILNKYTTVKARVEALKAPQLTSYIESIKALDFNKLSKRQVNNCIKFMKLVREDERVGFIIHLVDSAVSINGENVNVKLFTDAFKDDLQFVCTSICSK